MKRKPDAINAILCVSDMHCGSSVGLAHPESEQASGNVVGFGRNHHQAWLWQEWQKQTAKAFSELDGANILLVVNGDATEGVHHRTAELIASSIEEHCGIALKCLQPIADRCAAVIVTKGTECHTHGMEDKLASDLKARSFKAQDKWLVDIHGCLCDVAHHMMPSSRKYLEATQLSVTLGNAQLNRVRAGHRVPSVFLRSHRHCGGVYSDGCAAIGVSGGWQFLTRHGHKVVTDSIPQPSIITLDWRGQLYGALPRITELKSSPPQDAIAKL